VPVPAALPGALRLKVAKDPSTGEWANAKVVSQQSFGHGTYTWRIARNAAQVSRRASQDA
jgi:hypothetical protein